MRLNLPGHGVVSFVRSDETATLAYHGRLALPASLTIDGTSWTVVSTAPSKYVPTVTVATLREK